MRFTEGMWMTKEGMTIEWMSNVERLTIDGTEVTLLLNKLQRHRGDTLNSPTVTATVSSPIEGVIGVKLEHWAGAEDIGPNFEVVKTNHKVGISHGKGEPLDVASGPLNLSVKTNPNELGFLYKAADKKLTAHGWRSIAYVRDGTTEVSRKQDGIYVEKQGWMLAALDLGVNEKVYGLGERFGPFVKNGQSVETWNEDGGTSSELAYKNVSFYLSSKGYGVFVNNSGKVNFEIQSERTTRVNISIQGESLEYFVVYGPTPKDVLRRYTTLTGKPSLPPAWTYGLWLTTSFTTSYDEKTVAGFLEGFRERDIPLSTFHFDCFWMRSYQWCDFEWDNDMFPDPQSYLQRLKDRGFHTCVWINPYIGQASPLFKVGKEKGYFIKRSDAPNTVWQWDNWQAGMAIFDVTNPEAREWYASHLKRLMRMGVDSFKTDFGERIPYRNVKYHDGSDPVRMHNYYAYVYNKLVWDTMEEVAGKGEGCLFARSGWAGSQKFPVHWGGDCESTFEAMAESLRGGLSLSLCGFGFWAHDIGGFEGTPPASLYKRWVQFGLLSSHSRLHGSSSYRVPWIYGEDSSEVLRDCVKRKIAMTPYILSSALTAHHEGTPVMRPMFLEFPHDLTTYNLDTQYMLGPNLLVAPIFTEEGEVTFYVPETDQEGEWVSWFDHQKRYAGGKWYTETHDFTTLPLLIRPGSATALNFKITRPDADDLTDGLEIIVNGAPDEQAKHVVVVDTKDVSKIVKTITLDSSSDDGYIFASDDQVMVIIL